MHSECPNHLQRYTVRTSKHLRWLSGCIQLKPVVSVKLGASERLVTVAFDTVAASS